MIGDFIDRYLGGILLAGFVLLLALLVAAAAADTRQKSAACDRMWRATRSSADTIAVISRCDIPAEHNTTVVPAPVIIQGGRR